MFEPLLDAPLGRQARHPTIRQGDHHTRLAVSRRTPDRVRLGGGILESWIQTNLPDFTDPGTYRCGSRSLPLASVPRVERWRGGVAE
jgi:hypothetical protein